MKQLRAMPTNEVEMSIIESLRLWQRSVYLMRIACQIAFVAAIIIGIFAWRSERYEIAMVDAFLAGVNLMLTWIQWRVFKI